MLVGEEQDFTQGQAFFPDFGFDVSLDVGEDVSLAISEDVSLDAAEAVRLEQPQQHRQGKLGTFL